MDLYDEIERTALESWTLADIEAALRGDLETEGEDDYTTADCKRGEQVARSGQVPFSHLDQMALRHYRRLNRELTHRRGECWGGCDAKKVDAVGVCQQTARVCPRLRLGAIMERWTMSTTETKPEEFQLVLQATQRDLLRVEEVRTQTRIALAEAETNGQDMLKGLIVARAIQELRKALSPAVMQDVMALMNSPLGFDTDRKPPKKEPYDVETVRDCAIVAMLNGFSIVGNEWNIMSGRFYAAQKGLERLVLEWPGIRDLQIELGVPVASGERGALVPASASWAIESRRYRMEFTSMGDTDTRIPIRVTPGGEGVDAILGKAKRKIYARILERLNGVSPEDTGEIEGDEAAPVVTVSTAPRHLPRLADALEYDSGPLIAAIEYAINEAESKDRLNEIRGVMVEGIEAGKISEEATLALDAALQDRAQIMEG